VQARQLLRRRRSGPASDRLRVAIAESAGHANQRLARRSDPSPEDERARDTDGARGHEDHAERPKVVLRQEHGACAGPRADAHADHGDDRHGGGLRAEAPAPERTQHQRAGNGGGRGRPRREQSELGGLVHGSNL
jgi:hypothetical protein